MRGISFVRMDSKQTEKLIKVDEEVEERKKDVKRVVDIPDATADRRSRLRPKSARSIRGIFNDENVPNEEAIYKLNERTCFHKVRSLDKFVCRKYHIDLDTMQLHYGPSIKPFMCKDVPYYDLCDLSEVRKGWESDRYNVIESRFRRKLHASIGPKNLPQLEENNCFSLIFDNGIKTEDLVAPNVETRDVWVKGLNFLIASYKNQHINEEYDVWLKKQFREADENKNGNLCFKEVVCLLSRINICLNEKHAKAFFDMAYVHKHKMNIREWKGEHTLDWEEFLIFYQLINQRPELDQLFQDYSVNSTCIMGPEELRDFLIEEQKMTKATLADCEAYISRYEPKDSENPGYLSIKGFCNLFKSIDFDIFNRSHRVVCEVMSEPLSDYYIASSYNTIQMSNEISVKSYQSALTRGCRCIDLEVIDGDKGEPIVCHGLSATILLRDVLQTIQKYAFKTTQYPLILSMDIHCSFEQQIVIASLIRQILTDYLYDGVVDNNKSHLPSPETLVRKILIKSKKLPKIKSKKLSKLKKSLELDAINELESQPEDTDEEEEEEDGYDSDNDISDNDLKDDTIDGNIESKNIKITEDQNKEVIKNTENLNSVKKQNNNNNMNRSNTFPSNNKKDHRKNIRTNPDQSNGDHYPLGMTSSVPYKPTPVEINASKKQKLAKELSDLVTYCVAKKFQNFDDCLNERKWKYYEMISLEEEKSETFSKTKPDDQKYVKFTKKHLVRTYPKGDLTNYNPISHWNMGSQLVALNYQIADKPMLFNEALFAMNGKCGYVLKSDYLRKGKEYGMSGRSSVINAPTSKIKKVWIKIISGQHIPKPGNSLDGEIVDPYVELRVYGHPADSTTEFKTSPVKNNGFNPIWEESTEFIIRLPDMAFIYFAVRDNLTTDSDVILGQYMLAFPAIMEGYRTVNLVDSDNRSLSPASLLVHIAFKDVGDYWSPE